MCKLIKLWQFFTSCVRFLTPVGICYNSKASIIRTRNSKTKKRISCCYFACLLGIKIVLIISNMTIINDNRYKYVSHLLNQTFFKLQYLSVNHKLINKKQFSSIEVYVRLSE